MNYNNNTQCTTIYHETFYCIQYINGSLAMYYTAAMMGEHYFIQYYNEICPSLQDPARAPRSIRCCCCLAASPSRKQ